MNIEKCESVSLSEIVSGDNDDSAVLRQQRHFLEWECVCCTRTFGKDPNMIPCFFPTCTPLMHAICADCAFKLPTKRCPKCRAEFGAVLPWLEAVDLNRSPEMAPALARAMSAAEQFRAENSRLGIQASYKATLHDEIEDLLGKKILLQDEILTMRNNRDLECEHLAGMVATRNEISEDLKRLRETKTAIEKTIGDLADIETKSRVVLERRSAAYETLLGKYSEVEQELSKLTTSLLAVHDVDAALQMLETARVAVEVATQASVSARTRMTEVLTQAGSERHLGADPGGIYTLMRKDAAEKRRRAERVALCIAPAIETPDSDDDVDKVDGDDDAV